MTCAGSMQQERGLNRNTPCILYVEVWELMLYFYPSAGGFKKQKSVLVGCRDGYDGTACVEASDLNGR